jgi:YkoY family integral membrane protein
MLDEILNSPFDFSVEALLILLILIGLEAILSADNAIALAAITKGLKEPKLETQALNIGLLIAYVLRITLILCSRWVLQFWQFEVLGGGYLLWLAYQHFSSPKGEDDQHKEPEFANVWQAIPVIAVTDLAFSLDSVTTAIAISDKTWLVVAGGTIGVITLRFMAGLFIRWLDEYAHLADAGYATVTLVGLRLMMRAINDQLVPPEWLMISLIIAIFIWGFSEKTLAIAATKTDIKEEDIK